MSVRLNGGGMACSRGEGFAELESSCLSGRRGVVTGAFTGVLEGCWSVLETAGDRGVDDDTASFWAATLLLLLLLLPSSLLGFFEGPAPREKEKADEEIGATRFPFPLSGGCMFELYFVAVPESSSRVLSAAMF